MDRAPLTVILPLAGAPDLQRNLAQALYILTAKPPAAQDAPVQSRWRRNKQRSRGAGGSA